MSFSQQLMESQFVNYLKSGFKVVFMCLHTVLEKRCFVELVDTQEKSVHNRP